jgi:RHS repeat-associated protein
MQPAACASRYTGKERDSESGLDYFGARYMSSSMGRFMSPDTSDGPDPVPFADLAIPQSLNLYSYVGNNPLSEVDDDGHDGAAPTATCGGGLGGLLCRLLQTLRGGGGGGNNPGPPPPPAPPGPPEGGPGTVTGPLIQAQNAARANPHFQPIPGGSTFCNMASCYIGQHAGSNMGPLMTNGVPNLANTDANTLAHSGSYHRVGPAEAQRLANMGKVVYGVYKEPGHGHIITVRPDNGPYTGSGSPSTGPNDPIINDIGRHIGVYPLSQQPSAGFRNGVIFYAPN